MMRIAIVLTLIALGNGIRLFAAEPETLGQYVHGRAKPLVENKAVLGLVVGVIDGEQEFRVCLGQCSLGGPSPDEQTLFEIGSVTKTFTGVLLADAIVREEVKLDEPVVHLLKAEATVPKYEEQEIRLVDLATHTSGLPRLPANMGLLVNPLNPYAHYEANDLYKFLSKHKLRRTPGKEYEYSNLGMGLLGFALARRAGKSYEELLEARICEPLNMKDTVVTLSKQQASRLASGISNLALPTMNWDFPALAGCGAIRSTLHDMLIYLRANLSPGNTPLAKAISLAQTSQFTIRAATAEIRESAEIGLGWHITNHDGVKIVWHNGMTGGYASFMALIPAKKWGIVVLGCTATGEIDNLGNGLVLERLSGKLPTGG